VQFVMALISDGVSEEDRAQCKDEHKEIFALMKSLTPEETVGAFVDQFVDRICIEIKPMLNKAFYNAINVEIEEGD